MSKSEKMKFFEKISKIFNLNIIVSTFLKIFQKILKIQFSKKLKNLFINMNKYYILYIKKGKEEVYKKRTYTHTYIHIYFLLHIYIPSFIYERRKVYIEEKHIYIYSYTYIHIYFYISIYFNIFERIVSKMRYKICILCINMYIWSM